MKTTDNLKLNSPELSDAANVLKISENFEKLDKLFETLSVKKSKTAVSEFNSKCCMPYIRFINESEEDITVTDSSAEEETTFTVKAGESYVEWISEASVTPDYSFSAALDVNYFVLVADAIGSGGGGTSDYAELSNKPKINNVELSGNKSLSDIGAGTYSKPTTGIPKTDLSEAVQLSLGRADTALQTEAHTGDYSKPTGGIPKTDLAEAVQNSLSLADTALQTEAHTGDYSKPSGGIPASDMTQSVQEALGKAHSHDNKSALDSVTAEKITQIGTNKSDISTIKGYINNGDSEAKNGTTCTINVPENVSDFASIAMVGGKTEKVTPESGDPYLVSAPVEKIVSNGRNLLNGILETSTISGISVTRISGNHYTANGTATAYPEFRLASMNLKAGTYYVKCKSYDGANRPYMWAGTSWGTNTLLNNILSEERRFILSADTTVYMELVFASGKNYSNVDIDIMICSEDNKDYGVAPYFETELSLTEITKNLPDYGIGISADCMNYVDFESGKYYRNVIKKKLGDFTFTHNTGWGGDNAFDSGVIADAKAQTRDAIPNIICNKYLTITPDESYAHTGDKTITLHTNKRIYIIDSSTTNESTFNNMVKDYEVIYELATPEVYDLADTLYPIECESGGTITFVNEHSLDVPNKVIYKKEV